MSHYPSSHKREFHICAAFNGHRASVDCFCEPVRIYWLKDLNGIPVIVVEHNDEGDVSVHRSTVIIQRDRVPDWVTSLLDTVDPFNSQEE
jgi:hypothetical protein